MGCCLGVTQSWTRLSDFTFTFHFHALEKEMATHSGVLAWKIPGTGKPGGLPLWGHTELDTTEATQQQQQQQQGWEGWRAEGWGLEGRRFPFEVMKCSKN